MWFEGFGTANTAITSNRAVPGENTAMEYKYATQIFKERKKKPSLSTDTKKKENSPTLDSIFHRPFLSLYFSFFFFYP